MEKETRRYSVRPDTPEDDTHPYANLGEAGEAPWIIPRESFLSRQRAAGGIWQIENALTGAVEMPRPKIASAQSAARQLTERVCRGLRPQATTQQKRKGEKKEDNPQPRPADTVSAGLGCTLCTLHHCHPITLLLYSLSLLRQM